MTYESITHEMIQALSDEIEAIKEGGGGRQVPLQNGRKVGFAAGRFLYVFDLAFELAVPDNTPAQLKVGDHSYRVTVVSVDPPVFVSIIVNQPQRFFQSVISGNLYIRKKRQIRLRFIRSHKIFIGYGEGKQCIRRLKIQNITI